MKLIDTHAHLYGAEFDEDRDEMLARAKSNGIQSFVLPAVNAEAMPSMFQLRDQYPNQMYLMTGLHPTYVKEDYESELRFVEEQLKSEKFCAIGEIGIDLYWDKTFLKEQIEAFRFQIQLAKKYDLPIAIHCRDAFDEVFAVLEKEKGDGLRGIFHCFTGTKEHAELALSYNMKLGIGGVVTFKNGKIDKFLNEIPIEHIVLETDAPYLAPAPYRGKRNESAYLSLIAQKVADVYGATLEEVAAITTANAKSILGI